MCVVNHSPAVDYAQQMRENLRTSIVSIMNHKRLNINSNRTLNRIGYLRDGLFLEFKFRFYLHASFLPFQSGLVKFIELPYLIIKTKRVV